MNIDDLKAIEYTATPGPWVGTRVFSEEWGENYWGIETDDGRPIGTFDGDNAVWLKENAAKANRDLTIVLRNTASEIIELINAVSHDYGHCEPWETMKAFDALQKKLESL